MLATIFFTVYAFGTVFVICELCQRISDQYDELNDIFGQIKWYLFPMKIQRLLPLIVMSTQELVSIECFGSIACDRETSKKVINTIDISPFSVSSLMESTTILPGCP